jgi:hypothetical protein
VSDSSIVAITTVTMVGIAGYLLITLVRSIRSEKRRSRLKRVWPNFALSIIFCLLFFLSWAGQAIAEWGVYRQEQAAHREPTKVSEFMVEFGQSTLENWQSEFLQLFSFVVLSAVLIHRGSAESRDSDDRVEAQLDEIKQRLDRLDGRVSGRND